MEEEALDLRRYTDVILRRWRLIVMLPLIAGVVAFGLSTVRSAWPTDITGSPTPDITSEVQYEATTVVLLEAAGTIGNYPELAKTGAILAAVIDDLGLEITPAELRPQVTAIKAANGIIRISVTNDDPEIAVSIASGIAQGFVSHVATLQETLNAEARDGLSAQIMALGQDPSSEGAQMVADILAPVAALPMVLVPAEILSFPLDENAPAGVSELLPLAALYGATIPDVARDTALGGVIGGLVAVGMIFLLDFWQGPVRSPDQLKKRFNLTHLGSLPKWNDKGKRVDKLAVTNHDDPASVEAIRNIATNIDFLANQQGRRILAVTSPDTLDGRTTVVANLGVALASAWENVILVDVDLRHPSLHHRFNLDNSIGLTTLINNPEMELNDVLQDTPYPRLRVITSGPVPSIPVETLRCPRMAWLMQQLRESDSTVLLDTPPVLATTDAAVVSSQADGILMVIDSNRGKLEEVGAAVSAIQRANPTLLGFIWNQFAVRPFSSHSKHQRYHRGLRASAPAASASSVNPHPHAEPAESPVGAWTASTDVRPR